MKVEEIEKIINGYNRKKREKAINITASTLRLSRSEIDYFSYSRELSELEDKFNFSKEKIAFDKMIKNIEENEPENEHILRQKYIEIVLSDSFHEYPIKAYQN